MRLRDNVLLDEMPMSAARPDLRDARTRLLERASAALEKHEYLLVELALKNGLTFRQLARVMSAPPGTICRRLRRVINRLSDPFTVALIDPKCRLPDQHRQIALQHIVQRKPLRELAKQHQLPLIEVRRIIEFVRGWYRGWISRAHN